MTGYFNSGSWISASLLALTVAFPEKSTRADDEALQAIQAEQAQALSRYYQKLVNNKGTSASQSLNAEVGPSMTKFSQLADDRQKQNDNLIFNRVFLSDGTNVEASKFNADPNQYLKAAADAAHLKPGATTAGLTASRDPSSISNEGSSISGDGTHGKLRPEYTLDGSKIPKEIQFAPQKR
jgi:hypothetical protein